MRSDDLHQSKDDMTAFIEGHGMRRFPGYGTVWAFWVIVGGMVVSLAGLLAFFRWKRWI